MDPQIAEVLIAVLLVAFLALSWEAFGPGHE